MLRSLLSILVIVLFFSGAASAQYSSGRSEISVIVNNEIYPYREFAAYVLPAEHLSICVLDENAEQYQLTSESGELDRVDDCRWIWTAPDEVGLHEIEINRNGRTAMSLQVFVMLSSSNVVNGRINGYVIGEYPEPLEDSPIYMPPDGFLRVAPESLGVNVSPNFKLGQFINQADDDYPKYAVLRERLLLKLEVLLEHLNDSGIEAESLAVISGYLTPRQNAVLGGASYSRHIYGGAATIIVDRDGDGRMDDLNGNGTLDNGDGVMLFEIIDELFAMPGKEYLQGGLFLYTSTNGSGTSVMLDARGFRKRWTNDSEVPALPENLRPKHKRNFE